MSSNHAIQQMRDLVDQPEFMTVNRTIFWRDLLGYAFVGWSLIFYVTFAHFNWFLYLFAVYCLYCGTMLVHEVSHLAKKVPYYRTVYNIILGWPNSYPAYIYDTHLFHHGKKTYGTSDDPEYAPIEHYNAFTLIKPLVLAFALPFIQWIRFGLVPMITPMLPRKAKHFLFQRFSTLVFDASYRRRLRNEKKEIATMIKQDLICALYKIALVVLLINQVLPLTFIVYYYFAIVIASILNMYRALFNHYYANSSGHSLSWEDHLRDTVTLTMGPIARLMFVNHLNYHGLHHLFPEMPYHQLGKAHHKLMRELPEDHPYRTSVHPHFFSLIKAVISSKRFKQLDANGTPQS